MDDRALLNSTLTLTTNLLSWNKNQNRKSTKTDQQEKEFFKTLKGQDEEGEKKIFSDTIMGQRWARQEVDDGVRLYHQQKHEEAMRKWRNALRKLRHSDDKFITLGYLTQANCEAGRYRDMLVYALHQIDLANENDDAYMRAEAYLNLARANERIGEYHKAVSYGRQSIQNPSQDPRTPGYAYLCIANAYLGFSNFQKSLEHFEMAMQVANKTQDRLLELQICVGLGWLFTQLKDLAKAIVFLRSALGLLRLVAIEDVRAKYRSLALCYLSMALRKKGEIAEAQAVCEEALKIANENGNSPIHSRCLLSLADILRDLSDSEKSWNSYQAALTMMQEMGDRLGQALVLNGMAKSAVVFQKNQIVECECQAVVLNRRCLDLAKSIGCKLIMLKCEARLQNLFVQLSDDESEEATKKRLTQLTQELGLFCNFCGQRYAVKDDALQALSCSHMFHEKCLKTYLGTRQRKDCPKCHYIQQRMSARDGSCTPSPATGQRDHVSHAIGNAIYGNAASSSSTAASSPTSSFKRTFSATTTTVDV